VQQFIVPQFIDVEDKVIGPITTRQFIVILAGALIIGISYKLFDFSLFATFGIFMLAVTGVIAFLKINGRPFHFFLLNLFQTLKKSKLRIWRHLPDQSDPVMEKGDFNVTKQPLLEKHYTSSRLAELSLVVDTQGAYHGEKENSSVMSVERGN
jgi:hypothetical protein